MDVRMSTQFRRERAAVPSARAFVRHALSGTGVPCGLLDPLVLAVAEACNNAILHAGGEAFGVTITIEAGHCIIVVSDTGEGFVPPLRAEMPAPDAPGHRGLALMQALVDRVEVQSSEAGTTVVLAHSLGPVRPTVSSNGGGGLRASR
jgi:anti-sigma regulatory factor (Ser/Thr protein kinase)